MSGGLWLRYFLSMVTSSDFFSNLSTRVMKKTNKQTKLLWWVWRKWLVILWFLLFLPKETYFWLYHSKAFQLKAGLLQAAKILACSMQESVSEAAKPWLWARRAQRWRRQGKASTESCILARLCWSYGVSFLIPVGCRMLSKWFILDLLMAFEACPCWRIPGTQGNWCWW